MLAKIEDKYPFRRFYLTNEESYRKNVSAKIWWTLLKEIHAERINRADRILLNTSLAVFEDPISETMRIAWAIALDPMAERTEQLAAIREFREADDEQRIAYLGRRVMAMRFSKAT